MEKKNNSGISIIFKVENRIKYGYAIVNRNLYKYFIASDPSGTDAEGFPLANTLENKTCFEQWIMQEWTKIK